MTYKILVGNNLDILPTLPDNSVDSIVTDPPYGLSDNKFVAETITRWVNGERDFVPDGKGFMGKSWDAFVPPPALWDECFRVLKPGGHLLAFFGSRTQDIGGLAIRMAGFEIRDSIGWVYGSGFPKSLDVSKAIDKNDAVNLRLQRNFEFTDWIKSTGITARQIDDITNTKMGSHYTTHPTQPTIATAELFDKLRPYLPEVPEKIEKLVAQRTVESENYKKRDVVGKGSGATNPGFAGDRYGESNATTWDLTYAHTDQAKQWQGWGTALKPALEPIVVARKPLIGTVAENVLTYGTGGLNIDASRIGTEVLPQQKAGQAKIGTFERTEMITPERTGRWPANLILDEYTADLLDEQSGTSTSKPVPPGIRTGNFLPSDERSLTAAGIFGAGAKSLGSNHNDSGGASRFFYVAKASKRDRNEGLENLEEERIWEAGRKPGNIGSNTPQNRSTEPRKNFHPTVKPTALMEYLIKLVTPPRGTVLDPFTGSGSTGKAAVLNGFDFIGIEMTEDYVPIIEGRLKHAEKVFAENETEKLF
jgi:DNA modification methylase